MNPRLVIAVFALLATSAIAQAQPGPPPNGPKPTKAEAQKVVQIITDDKAKTQAYCQLAKLNDQMAAADQKKDQKALDALSKQADALSEKIGPEYAKLMDGLEQIDPDSAEGKQFTALLAPLDNLCGK
jgi:hypothetical protein